MAYKLLVPMLCWLLALASVGHGAPPADAEPTRIIHFSVTASAEDGTPLANVVLRAHVLPQIDQQEILLTDAKGQATADWSIPPDWGTLIVQVQPGQAGRFSPEQDIATAEVSRRWSFRSTHFIPLTTEQSSYQIAVTGRPAVSASFRLMIDGQLATSAFMVGTGTTARGFVMRPSPCMVRGIPKGEVLMLNISQHAYPHMYLRVGPLDADAPEQEVNFISIAGSVPVSITSRTRVLYAEHKSRGVTVIRADGKAGHGFAWGPDGLAVTFDRKPCTLSPGDYYVLPDTSTVWTAETYDQFVGLLQDGHDASASGVPRLVIAEGAKDAALDVPDLQAAHAAVMAFIANPPPLPAPK